MTGTPMLGPIIDPSADTDASAARDFALALALATYEDARIELSRSHSILLASTMVSNATRRHSLHVLFASAVLGTGGIAWGVGVLSGHTWLELALPVALALYGGLLVLAGAAWRQAQAAADEIIQNARKPIA